MANAGADKAAFTSVLVCNKCHEHQTKAWAKTPHAKSLKSLKPGQRVEAKLKAKLDPDKDYTNDTKCLGCHTTGFGKPGGYDPASPDKFLARVGCESCHGAGSLFRVAHGDAESRMKREAETTPRTKLVTAGQNFEFKKACARCHLNYEGSPWKDAKAPYTPFTPDIDQKYKFNFEDRIRSDAIHTHYKLYDIFTGPPIPDFHEEFQSTAEEIE